MSDLEFYFDPVCPYCWQTSKWVRQVQRLAGIDVAWRFISLKVVNEPKGYAGRPHFREVHVEGMRMLRVAAAVREAHGDAAVGALYEVLGESIWEVDPPEAGDRAAIRAMHAEGFDIPALVAAAGLDAVFAEAAADESWESVIRDETRQALERAGEDVGTPILSFDPPDGPAFFGPVISELPDDADAVGLYESLRLLAAWDGFSELKRSVRRQPDVRVFTRLREAS